MRPPAVIICFIVAVPLSSFTFAAEIEKGLPSRVFAPYIDLAKATGTLEQIHAASGTKYFTLAFIISGANCVPAWGGTLPVATDMDIAKQIIDLRKAGGDVIIAFGGQAGQELGVTCPDVASLQAAYQAVIDKYKVKQIDLDVEGEAIGNRASVDRRSQALTNLVAANPGLRISYTLAVTPGGLIPDGLTLLKNAVRHKTPIYVVNQMTMDYGVPVPAGDMARNAISATKGTLRQLKSIGLRAKIGITPMIGMNDSPGETFSLADAQTVLKFADENKDVVLLSFWSVGRDNGSCVGTVSPLCSGVAQTNWEFSRFFNKY
ncbi:MAG TPA: chitinase [Terriglobales bacterium]|nr:chitinase [Terriglobales bacterium]